jgi:transposase-like protein
VAVLVELSVVEQRLRAVLEVVQDRLPVTEVAERYGVSRQAVHAWLRRYAAGGLDRWPSSIDAAPIRTPELARSHRRISPRRLPPRATGPRWVTRARSSRAGSRWVTPRGRGW